MSLGIQLQSLAYTDFNTHQLKVENHSVKVVVKGESCPSSIEQEVIQLKYGIQVICQNAWKNLMIFNYPSDLNNLLTFKIRVIHRVEAIKSQQIEKLTQEVEKIQHDLNELIFHVLYILKDLKEIKLQLQENEVKEFLENFINSDSFQAKKEDYLSSLIKDHRLNFFDSNQLSSILLNIPCISKKNKAVVTRILTKKFKGKHLEDLFRKAALQQCWDLIICILHTSQMNRRMFLEILAEQEVNPHQIIKISDEISDPLFKDFIKVCYRKMGRSPSEKLFYHRFDPQTLIDLKEHFGCYHHPINPETINQAFYSQNLQVLHLLFEHLSDKKLEKYTNHILKKTMEVENPKIGAILLNRSPSLPSRCSFCLLLEGISNGNDWFVEWVLSNGMKFYADENITLMSAAKKTYHLKMIKTLCRHFSSLDLSFSYPHLLELDKIQNKEELLKVVSSFAMNSPLIDLYELIIFYPHLSAVLPEALELTSLMVRFPTLQMANEVNFYPDMEAYLTASFSYALENRLFLKSVVPELHQLKREDLLKLTIMNRYKRMPKKNRAYKNKQIDKPTITTTPLITIKSTDIQSRIILIYTGASRYSWCLRHLEKLYFDKEKKIYRIPNPSSIIESDHNSFQYCYFLKDSKISNPYHLNTLNSIWTKWTHTSSSTIKDLQNHLEELHQEILDYSLDITDHSNQKIFFEKVARCYWLMATLCETWRGTPHNVMIWLNAIYEYHHLPFPIPKKKHFFLDNSMLVYPFEKVIEEWNTFFEPPLDQALSGRLDLLKNLLKENGLLLRLCSERIRNNQELGIIAIQQNPEAFQYLTKNLQANPLIVQIYSESKQSSVPLQK